MMDPLAWARIAPHQTCSPHGRSGEVAIGSSVSGSIRSTQPKGGGPENAAIVPPRYHSPRSRPTTMTFHLSLRRKTARPAPATASNRPAVAFCRRFPPHSTGHVEGQ